MPTSHFARRADAGATAQSVQEALRDDLNAAYTIAWHLPRTSDTDELLAYLESALYKVNNELNKEQK